MTQIDQLSGDEEQPQEQELDLQQQPKDSYHTFNIYVCCIRIAVVAVIIAIISLCIYIVLAYLQTKPLITINYNYQSVSPLKSTLSSNTAVKQSTSNISILKQSLKVIPLHETKRSSLDVFQIESANQNYRLYQQAIRKTNLKNMQRQLNDYRQKLISQDSQIKYDHYLKALKFMALTTYPINHQEDALTQLIEQEKKYYQDKYSFSTKDKQICVITTLTHKGLQTGNYYYLLKSIYQQDYQHFKHIVINYPRIDMADHLQQILSVLDESLNSTIFVNLTYSEGFNQGAALYTVLNQHCHQTDITIFLKDTGELIGTSVFRILSQFHQVKETNVVFTNYILEMSKFVSNNQDGFKYKVQMYPKNLSQPRKQQYKTKYLKSFHTKFLLQLPELIFKDSSGKWKDGLSQSSLQFAALQANCGKYYLVQQICFFATSDDMQSSKDVIDSQNHEALQCLNSTGLQGYSQNNQLRDHQ